MKKTKLQIALEKQELEQVKKNKAFDRKLKEVAKLGSDKAYENLALQNAEYRQLYKELQQAINKIPNDFRKIFINEISPQMPSKAKLKSTINKAEKIAKNPQRAYTTKLKTEMRYQIAEGKYLADLSGQAELMDAIKYLNAEELEQLKNAKELSRPNFFDSVYAKGGAGSVYDFIEDLLEKRILRED